MGEEMKRFIYFLVWAVIILVIMYVSFEISLRLKEYQATYFKPMPYVIFSVVFSLLMGMLFRLPQLVIEIRNKKRWSIDWVKLFVISIPALYFAIIPIFFIANIPLVPLILVTKMFDSGLTTSTIAGIVFGYSFLDSVKEK